MPHQFYIILFGSLHPILLKLLDIGFLPATGLAKLRTKLTYLMIINIETVIFDRQRMFLFLTIIIVFAHLSNFCLYVTCLSQLRLGNRLCPWLFAGGFTESQDSTYLAGG